MKLTRFMQIAFGVGALVGGVIYGYRKAGNNAKKLASERRYDKSLEEAFSTSDAVASY